MGHDGGLGNGLAMADGKGCIQVRLVLVLGRDKTMALHLAHDSPYIIHSFSHYAFGEVDYFPESLSKS